jgi:predicted transcriptional regulator
VKGTPFYVIFCQVNRPVKAFSYSGVQFYLISISIFNRGYILSIEIYEQWKYGFLTPKFTSNIDQVYRKKLERFVVLENEHKRRDRLYIIAEILKIAEEGSLKTQIMYKANLSFAQMNEYLSFLLRMGLLEIQKEARKKIYITTAKGEEYLSKHGEISNLLGNNERKNFVKLEAFR